MRKVFGKVLLFLVVLLTFFGVSSFADTQEATKVSLAVMENDDIRIIVDLETYVGSLFDILANTKVLRLTITNKTGLPLKIIWDESLFTDNYGKPVKLIREGQKFIDATRAQVPTVILPNSTLSIIAVPESHIYYSGGWQVLGISGIVSNRKLFVTYEVNDKKKYIETSIIIELPSKSSKNQKTRITFPFFNILYPFSDKEGNITSYKGFSALLFGYVEKNYYGSMKFNSWNNFWHWGTAFIVLPYIGIGTEYVNGDGTFAFSLFTLYIVPFFEFSVSF
ncbi:hypothetical protein [Fervidobacterium gondwanense]|uniref:Uncharacterized protein n=1 Tax=Fervidobacterium gondwanense DSM 13020 TaxID=1121883 RepID=A0A1M7TET2_FERGO|nr:hypothetical protein [Fervidobacterium gondwanense]SHN69269.1 hypothetical protein SAMN02745226_01927 [Fervidobacterium gondwanense DSM 13020]